ncbi:MAG: DegV family protein [Synergistota bacterium]|nr:DegV family protein [Synergistota bacterium]
MKIRTINGMRLHKGFAAGTHHVLRQQNELNRMNVYPVPDGDTGTNLAATVQSVYEGTSVTRSVSQTSSSMADAALTGARDNSGLIMAQFLYGFARESEGRDVLDVSHFGNAVSGAVPYAEEALDKPVEGTILTVMREWASEVKSIASRTRDFAMLLPGSLDVARRSLMETPSRLPVLAKAGVVDAGAQDFVNFLEGIVDFLETGDARMFSRRGDVFSQEQFHEEFLNGDPAYRFCTEALINGKNLDISGIRSDMAPFGDSLIVGGHQQRVRVHIHTDEPDRMFFTIRNRGAIKQQKAALALAGGADADEVCSMLEKDVVNSRIFVSLRTVRYMVKGVRISPLKGLAAKMLGLKPMITVDPQGRAKPFGRNRSWRANITNIVSAVEAMSAEHPVWGRAVVHLNALEEARQAAAEMEMRTGMPPAYIMEISPVLGTHSGPGSVAIGVLCE